MEQKLTVTEGIREEMPDDVFACVNLSAIADFFISAEAAVRAAQDKEGSRKHIEAMIKETFKDGD